MLQHYSFTVLHYYTTTVILYYSTTLLQYTGVNNLNGNWITATAKTKAPNFIQKNVLVYQTTGVKNFASMDFWLRNALHLYKGESYVITFVLKMASKCTSSNFCQEISMNVYAI